MKEPARPVLRDTDDAAREAARLLLREARHAVLACLEPETGDPLASRVATAPDITGDPVILVSRLSAHTGALLADNRASLLFGEAGRGDPLAHGRLSVRGLAEPIGPGQADHKRIRRRFLARMPQAQLYVDFPDFLFMRIAITQASYNAGFARAYAMARDDLADVVPPDVADAEPRVVAHMNDDHANAVDRLVSDRLGRTETGWTLATLDARGFDAIRGDEIVRLAFRAPVISGAGFRQAFVDLVSAVPPADPDQGL